MRLAPRLPDEIAVPTNAFTATACLFAVALAAGACTGGAADEGEERTGAVEAVVVDRAPTADGENHFDAEGNATFRRVADPSSVASPAVRGSMIGSYIVSLYSEEGYWVDVGRGGEVRVPLQDPWGHARVTVGDHIPAGTYTRVRVTMCHSGARLDPGTRIGANAVDAPTGLKLTETGDVFVRRDVEPFTVEKHRLVRIEIDLNAERWLTTEALESGEIDVPTFERAVDISIRTSPE